MENYGVCLTELKKVEVRELPMPEMTPGRAIIRVDYCGVCGSDMHFFSDGHIGNRHHVKFPFILGHECSGTVFAIGENKFGFSQGDHVCVEPAVPCGECEYCLSGHYNMCPNKYFISTPPIDGAMQRYISFPIKMLHKLPDAISMQAGAMVEPMAVGAYAVEKSAVKPTDTVAILGMGCIGLCTLIACLERGVKRVIVSDICKNRLDKAMRIGATDAIDPTQDDAVEAINSLTRSNGANVVFETAGSRVTAAQTCKIVARCGTIIMVGNIIGDVPYSFRDIYTREATIKSIFRYRNTFPYVIDAMARKRMDVSLLSPDVFDYNDAQKAFDTAINQKDKVTKAIIKLF